MIAEREDVDGCADCEESSEDSCLEPGEEFRCWMRKRTAWKGGWLLRCFGSGDQLLRESGIERRNGRPSKTGSLEGSLLVDGGVSTYGDVCVEDTRLRTATMWRQVREMAPREKRHGHGLCKLLFARWSHCENFQFGIG